MNNFSEIKRPNNFNPSQNSLAEKSKLENFKIPTPPHKNFLQKLQWLFIVIIILTIIGGVYLSGIFNENKFSKNNQEWQAIFLINGEVYFGKLVKQNVYEIMVENIFYLQNKEPLHQGANVNKNGGDIALIKLGSEIHGPTDEIRFNRSQVAYIEDMKDESKIVKAIRDYLKK